MEETKKCPYCGEEIMATAKKCRFCGEWLDKEQSPTPAEAPQQNYARTINATTAPIQQELSNDTTKVKMFSHPFSFEGRINRKEFSYSFLIFYAYILLAALVSGLIEDSLGTDAGTMIIVALLIPALIFLLAQGCKRCHDFGITGWLQLLLSPILIFILMFIPRKKFDNEYGAYIQY